jgi:molybdopterin-guanine dinucleotide biosynthesis protein A
VTEYDAVVLAGGRAARLGGVDKPALLVGGVALLDRVLAAVPDARRRIVVGPDMTPDPADPMPEAVIRTREEPPGGGPVAAIAAGLVRVRAPVVVVLAADLPFLTAATVGSLLAALGGDTDTNADTATDVAVLVDDADHDQRLVAAWRASALRSRLGALGEPAGQAVRALFDGASVVRVGAVHAAGRPPPWLDCDTGDDLRRAREWT